MGNMHNEINFIPLHFCPYKCIMKRGGCQEGAVIEQTEDMLWQERSFYTDKHTGKLKKRF